MKNSISDIIEALTPLTLAAVGALIGIVVLVQPNIKETTATAGLGLAGTAIAGAAGLARSSTGEKDASLKQNGNLKVETPTSSAN